MADSKTKKHERKRRRALKLAKALDFNCDVCSAHEGHPCQNTGRSRTPGTEAKVSHKCRLERAQGYLALRNWVSPGVAGSDSKLYTGLARTEWQRFLEDCGGPATEESDHDYTTGWGPSTIVIAPGETKPVPSGAKSLHIVCISGGGDGTRGDQ